MNNKDEESKDIKIRGSLYHDDYKIFDESNVRIEKVSDIRGNAKFDIIVDKLKGNKKDLASFHLLTEGYDDVAFDYYTTPKQYCIVNKFDIALVKDVNTTIKALKKLGFTSHPPMSYNEVEHFKVEVDKKEYMKVGDYDIFYKFKHGKDECSTKKPINPKELI